MRFQFTIKYRTPALNVTLRQHWSEQQREKKRGWAACVSALQDIAADPAIPIHSRDRARDCLIFFTEADLSKATNRGGSSSKPIRCASAASRKKKPK